MTIMSPVSAESFSELARVVFPENTLFDPVDYLEVFNLRRDAPLGAHTFKKYVSIVSGSKFFPSLGRQRAERGEYKYVVRMKSAVPSSPESCRDVTQDPSPPPLTGARISDDSLLVFVSRTRHLSHRNTWYKPETLRRYYNRGPHRSLKSKTFSYYMSLAFRRGLWEGLVRKREGKVFRYSWDSKDNVSVTPPVEYASSPPEEEQYLVRDTCGACGGHSPLEAKFCMHCGGSLGRVVRVAIQEDFFNMRVTGQGADDVEVLKAVRQRIEKCVIRRCGGENGIITYTVSGE